MSQILSIFPLQKNFRRCERYFATTYPHGVDVASDGQLNVDEDNGDVDILLMEYVLK